MSDLGRRVALAVFLGTAALGALPANGSLRIVTSFYPIYIAALNVAGGVPGVEISSMTKPSAGCLHDYQFTTEDLLAVSKADVLVINGAGMEPFVDKIKASQPSLPIIDASQGIALLRDSSGENPHVWVSVSLAEKQVENIAAGLAGCDPKHATDYQRNADAYVRKLEALKQEIAAGLAHVRSRDIVTFHQAFAYLAKEFGLNVVGVIEREPGSEPSAREMAATIDLIRRTSVRAVFTEPQYPAKSAEAIARETGVALFVLDPAVTGPMEADAYLKIMEENLRELQKALK